MMDKLLIVNLNTVVMISIGHRKVFADNFKIIKTILGLDCQLFCRIRKVANLV